MKPGRSTDGWSYLSQITPVILTFNEAPNIGRVLERLTAFDDVVVVDSGSDDGTLEIVRGHPNTRVVERPFDSHAQQWNFAIQRCDIRTEWVLALDADYLVSGALLDEISNLSPPDDVHGYRVSFKYCISGRALSGTLYPPVIALFRRRQASIVQDGHTQRVQVAGHVESLRNHILHDDRKALSRWLSSQGRYADLEADFLFSQTLQTLSLQDRLRRMIIVAPWLVPLYFLFVRRGILDGWRGVYYAMQRGVAETVLALCILEKLFVRRSQFDPLRADHDHAREHVTSGDNR